MPTETLSLFDLVLGYPDTLSQIDSYKKTLCHDMKHSKVFQDELKKRLFHQGIPAKHIMNYYLLCIKTFKYLDPTCDILLPIVDTIEEYVRTYRNDMVQAVVERLREDDTNTLCPNPETVYVFARDELYKGGSHSHHLFEESRGEFFDKEWLERKSSDLMAMLISLCASKDTCAKDNFLKEYQAQLSVALLKHQQYSTEKIRLEKMKQRLGESIENATVMINDMENSQRINKRIYENNHQWPMSFHGFILSRHSWIDPEEEEEKEPTMALTPLCLEAMKTYSSEYSRVQPSRSLRWLPELGRVNLTLEFKSGSLDITVDPIDATVISHFSSKDIPWTADSIAKKCGVSLEKTMKSLNFWEEQGILKMTNTGRFQLVKE